MMLSKEAPYEYDYHRSRVDILTMYKMLTMSYHVAKVYEVKVFHYKYLIDQIPKILQKGRVPYTNNL